MEDIIISELKKEEINQCIELLQNIFPDYNEKTFNWRNGSKNKLTPIIICAKKNSKIISFTSWIPWEFNYNNKKYIGYQAGDSATDANFRGRGILKNILKYGELLAQKRKIDFFIGFPSQMSYGTYYREKYIPVSINYYQVRLLNPLRKIENDIKINHDFYNDAFLYQADKITPSFNENYYNWRYTDNPKDYKTIQYIENNNKAVFIIRIRKWKGVNEAILLDCQFTTYNDAFIENSIKFLDSCIMRKVVYIRTFFNSNTDKGKLLLKYFPIQVKRKNHICIIKPLSEKSDQNIFLNCYNWDIMPHCIDDL